jgi:hypothetical protein
MNTSIAVRWEAAAINFFVAVDRLLGLAWSYSENPASFIANKVGNVGCFCMYPTAFSTSSAVEEVILLIVRINVSVISDSKLSNGDEILALAKDGHASM